MRSRLLPAALAVVLAATLTACGSGGPRSLLDSIRGGEVILGTKYDQPGLGQRNPDKSMTGFDVDVIEYVVAAIADELGVEHPEISWKEAPSAQRETLIRNGEVDAIAATYSISTSRDASVEFGGPYLETHQALLVRRDDESLTGLADLDAGRKLCSVAGSTSAQNVEKQLPGVQLQQFDSYSSCVEALHQRKVDALTTDATILAGFSDQYPGEFQIVGMEILKDTFKEDGSPDKKAGDPFSTERYGIGVTDKDTEAQEAINRALDKMIADGEWERVLRDNVGRAMEEADYPAPEPPTPGDLSFLD